MVIGQTGSNGPRAVLPVGAVLDHVIVSVTTPSLLEEEASVTVEIQKVKTALMILVLVGI